MDLAPEWENYSDISFFFNPEIIKSECFLLCIFLTGSYISQADWFTNDFLLVF